MSGEQWHEAGDGHGYAYQYIGPIHYLCECGDYFLNRERWLVHKFAARVEVRLEQMATDAPGYYDEVIEVLRQEVAS